MCGRYGFVVEDEKEILNRFDIESADFELRDSYNVAPTQEMPIVERHSPNSLHLRKWGINVKIKVPKVVEGKTIWTPIPKFVINAQSEKIMSFTWKKAFLENRCIVPASYFYEWKKLSDGKQPYLIRLKNQKLFGFAGIIVKYHEDDKEKEGYIIITTTPNSLMKQIHHRMPVILKKEDEDEWLNPDSDPENLLKLLNPYPTSEMEAYPISSLVNSPKNNFPELLKEAKIDL